MKRDMDLVRKILLACENEPTGYAPHPLDVEGYSPAQIGYHVMLMAQAGLLDASDATHMASDGPDWMAQHLTWEGHEFLDAARNDTTWAKAKAAVSAVGGLAFDVLKQTLVNYMVDQAGRAIGRS